MKQLSRREFLKASAAGIGALTISQLLAACGVQEIPASPTTPPTLTSTEPPPPTDTPVIPTSTETLAPTDTATPVLPTATDTPVPIPDLVVARNGEPETLVRRAIAAIGGMEKFVPKGANVIIKPNMCVSFRTYEYAATTNPWVVGTLVKMAFEAGAAKVRVMDHTWREELWEAYRKSGIQKEVEAAGGVMEFMYPEKYVKTELPQGVDLKDLWLYDEILNAEVLINVPIAKHHQDAKLTLGIKNLMGTMDHRLTMHTNMGQRLADLASRVRPTLNVMDAVRMLMAFGPTGGALSDVKKIDTVIVSQDIVALDSYTATLFDMKPGDLDYVTAATAMGIGRSDLENLRIEEINIT
jgi:uncharacterized protein (DUF362 family)